MELQEFYHKKVMSAVFHMTLSTVKKVYVYIYNVLVGEHTSITAVHVGTHKQNVSGLLGEPKVYIFFFFLTLANK